MGKLIQIKSKESGFLNFIPISGFHFPISSMTTEALRKLIEDYQFGDRGIIPPAP
jgi:hypothetical protein